MVYTAISFIIISVLFLIIGLINPAWVFFWQKKPERFWVIGVSLIMIMGSLTFYGEGLRQKQEAEDAAEASKKPTADATTSKDTPTPTSDVPEPPKAAE